MNDILNDIYQSLNRLTEQSEKNSIVNFQSQKQEAANRLLSGAIKRLLEKTKSNPDAYIFAMRYTSAKQEYSVH